MQFQRELDEMIQEENFYGDPTVNRLCDIVARLIHQWEQTQQRLGTLGASSSSSALGKHPRNPKPSDTSNRHAKGPEEGEISQCHGCGRIGHHRDTCDLSSHPDFNRYGNWVGSASETAIRAHLRASTPNKKYPNVRLYKHLRADGTAILAPQHQRPSTPPMDANTRRDNDDNDRSGRGGGTGGRSSRDPRRHSGRGKVSFDKSIYGAGKGTQCLTDIVTHLSCNCGESDVNSSYRQCLVSM